MTRALATISGAEAPHPVTADPFHAGEQAVQARVSSALRQRMAEMGGQVLRDQMPDQHRQFFAQLPFVFAGSVDAGGQPWATALVGERGFLQAPDARHLTVRSQPLPFNPAGQGFQVGQSIGLLGLEFESRRRNRLNGRVVQQLPDGFQIEVEQSFGNCPKYISAREPLPGRGPQTLQVVESTGLDAVAQALVEHADTFFIATAHPASVRNQGLLPADRSLGADVSHRGGPPGFVRVRHSQQLTVPDLAGNFYFNTLGNLQLEPRAGLLFIDFDNGDLLYLAAQVEIQWQGPELAAFAGAQRLMHLRLTRVIRVSGSWPIAFGSPRPSPAVAGLGPWSQR